MPWAFFREWTTSRGRTALPLILDRHRGNNEILNRPLKAAALA
jgi:hypothetical protein